MQLPPPPPSFPEPGNSPLPPPSVPAGPGAPYPQGPSGAFPRTSGLAIGSLVVGLLSIVLGVICCLPGPIGAVAAIVMGRIARTNIRRSQGMETGAGLALAGEIIGWLVVVLGLLAIVAVVGLIVVGNETKNVFSNISAGLASPSP